MEGELQHLELEQEQENLRKVDISGCLGWRHTIAVLVFIVVSICYADRTNIGIVLARQDFPGIPHSDKGLILSAFFVGYLSSQVPGSVIARRWGPAPTLLLAAGTWTTFDALTPVLARAGFVPLYLGRVCMGIGEGLVFPTQHALTNFWVPAQERATLVTLMTSGQEFGSVLANAVSPRLLKSGVGVVFAFWAVAAVLWMLLFALFGASAPEIHARCVRSGEAAWIQAHRGARTHIEEVQLSQVGKCPVPKQLLLQPSAWAIIAMHVGCNYSWYVILSWMPTYFADVHGIDLASKSHMLAVPYLAGFIGLNVAGRVSDALVSCGIRIRHVRKGVQVVALLGGNLCLALSVGAASAAVASLWMSAALFFWRMQSAGFWVNMIDICPTTAATLMGVSNSIGTIPGIVGQPVTQAILDSSGSWAAVFGVGFAVGVVSLIVYLVLGDDASVEESSAEVDGDRDGPHLHGIGHVTLDEELECEPS